MQLRVLGAEYSWDVHTQASSSLHPMWGHLPCRTTSHETRCWVWPDWHCLVCCTHCTSCPAGQGQLILARECVERMQYGCLHNAQSGHGCYKRCMLQRQEHTVCRTQNTQHYMDTHSRSPWEWGPWHAVHTCTNASCTDCSLYITQYYN